MKPRALRAVPAAVACWLLLAPAAQADWERITSASPTTTSGQTALVRTPDALHMVWRATSASYRHRIDHRAVLPDGTLSPTVTVTEDWIEMSDPGLTASTEGLRAIWGGVRSAHPDEINTELNTALTVDGGTTWSVQDGSIVQPGTDAADAPVSAAAQADGAPLAAWATGGGTWTHRGVDPAVPVVNIQAPLGGSGTRPGVASVGARTVVAWYSSSSAGRGVYAQEIAPDGSAAGAPTVMPGTTSVRTPMPGRTPVASRIGGKVFVVYAVGSTASKRILLWNVGSGTTRTIARAAGEVTATVTADPQGRLYVAWTTRSGGRDRVMVRRSNARATSFGDVVDASRPPSGAVARSLDMSAIDGSVDVVAGYSAQGSERVSSFFSRVELER
jgi:hypothetical protein